MHEDVWLPVPIKTAPALASLRTIVIGRSEKRMPKWKFRLATDLVMRIQPKLSSRAFHKFECKALFHPAANEQRLDATRREIEGDYLTLAFDVTSTSENEGWTLKVNRVGWRKRRPSADVMLDRDRLVTAFNDGLFDQLRPAMMLGCHCLYCGKALTDPVSQARLIGPECAGTSSPNLSGLRDLSPTHDYRMICAFQTDATERAVESLEPASQDAFYAALDGATEADFEQRLENALDTIPANEFSYFWELWTADEEDEPPAAKPVELDMDAAVKRLIDRNPVLAKWSKDELAGMIKDGTFNVN